MEINHFRFNDVGNWIKRISEGAKRLRLAKHSCINIYFIYSHQKFLIEAKGAGYLMRMLYLESFSTVGTILTE